jgi:dihydrofolate reductase
MGKVVSSASMSLDGFIANPDNTLGSLFDWYESGDIKVPTAVGELSFTLTPQGAEYWPAWTAGLGALVVGRELFDFADGWKVTHPLGIPVVVLTHERED